MRRRWGLHGPRSRHRRDRRRERKLDRSHDALCHRRPRQRGVRGIHREAGSAIFETHDGGHFCLKTEDRGGYLPISERTGSRTARTLYPVKDWIAQRDATGNDTDYLIWLKARAQAGAAEAEAG